MERCTCAGIIDSEDIHAGIAERDQELTQFLRRMDKSGIRIFRKQQRQAEDDGELPPYHFPDSMQDIAGETGASQQTTAVFIATVIRFGAQKLVNQSTLTATYFHGIKSQHTSQPRSLSKGIYHISHAVAAHFIAPFLTRHRVNSTGADGETILTEHTSMKQLRRYATRKRMHSPAYPLPQTQGRATGEMSHVLIYCSGRVIYRNRFSEDKPQQMRSPETIILHQLLSRRTRLRMAP